MFTNYIDQASNEISILKNEITKKDPKYLKQELIACIQNDKDINSDFNTIGLLSKYEIGLYAREIRNKCKANIFFDKPWNDILKDIIKEAKTSRSTIDNCMDLSCFDDCLDYKEIKVTKLTAGISTLLRYIELVDYQEDDILFKNSDIYVIKNVLKKIDSDADPVEKMKNICDNPSEFWKDYLKTMEFKDSLSFVKDNLTDDLNLSYLDVKKIVAANDGDSSKIQIVKDIINKKSKKNNAAVNAMVSLVSNKILEFKNYAEKKNLDQETIDEIVNIFMTIIPKKEEEQVKETTANEQNSVEVKNEESMAA